MTNPNEIPSPEASKGALAARNTAFLTAGQVVARAIGAAWLIFLARYLGGPKYGTYTLATSFVGFVAVVSDLGVGITVLRRIVQEPEQAPDIVAAGLGLTAVLSALAVSLAVGLTVALGYRGQVLLISTVASLAIIPNALGALALVIFQAHARFGLFISFVLTNLIMGIALGIVALGVNAGVLGLAAAILCAAVLNAIGAWAVALRFLRPRPATARPYLRPLFWAALPIGLAAYAQTATFQVDNLLIGHALGLRTLAFYDVAFMFYSSAVEVFFTPLIGVAFPLLAKVAVDSEGELRRVLRRAFGLILAVTAPITVGGALMSSRLVMVVFGHSYAPGGPVLRILILALIPSAYWGTATKLLIIRERNAAYIAISAGLLAFTSVGVWVGLHLEGLTGAAIGVLLAHLITALLAALLVRQNAWVIDRGRFVKVVSSVALMGFVVWALRNEATVIVIGAGAAVYVAMALALRVLDVDDRRALTDGLLRPLVRLMGGSPRS